MNHRRNDAAMYFDFSVHRNGMNIGMQVRKENPDVRSGKRIRLYPLLLLASS